MALPEELLNWPVDAPSETETLRDEMLLGGYNPEATVEGKKQRKFTFLQFRTWLHSAARTISAVWTFSAGIVASYISLTPGRKFAEELTSDNISVAGWYTIAETDAGSAEARSCRIMVSTIGGALGCEVSCYDGSVAKTLDNTTLKLIKPSANSSIASVTQITAFRLAKSDTTATSGFKIQAYLDPSSARQYTLLIDENTSRIAGGSGFYLVDPTTTDNNLTPSGSAATYLEAGAEYSMANTQVCFPIQGRVSDADTLVLSVPWNDIPKQGATAVSITYPTTSFSVIFSDDSVFSLTEHDSLGNIKYDGNLVSFSLVSSGAFASVVGKGIITFRTVGTGGKITLS